MDLARMETQMGSKRATLVGTLPARVWCSLSAFRGFLKAVFAWSLRTQPPLRSCLSPLRAFVLIGGLQMNVYHQHQLFKEFS